MNQIARLFQNKSPLWLSALPLLACLLFTAAYIRPSHEPLPAYNMLVSGWLGPLYGHFSWLANPLILIGFLYARKKPGFSLGAGILSLIAALSFLLHSKIAVSEAPTYAPITGYGWGYFLWVMGIGVFCISQFFHTRPLSEKPQRNEKAFQLVWLIASLGIFSWHYFVGDHSPYAVSSLRQNVFEQACKSAGTTIKERITTANGIFLDPPYSQSFRFDNNEGWVPDRSGESGPPGLRFEQFGFYETVNRDNRDSPEMRFRRFTQDTPAGIPINKLSSEFMVSTISLDFPGESGIYGEKIDIRKMADKTEIATLIYFHNRVDKTMCGNTGDKHSWSGIFMQDVFGKPNIKSGQ